MKTKLSLIQLEVYLLKYNHNKIDSEFTKRIVSTLNKVPRGFKVQSSKGWGAFSSPAVHLDPLDEGVFFIC